MAKVSLPDEAVTFDINVRKKGKYEEAKVLYLAALEGRRRVLREEHKNTFAPLGNLGIVLKNVEDYEVSMDYYQQALRVQEMVLSKKHPETQGTITNMVVVFIDRLKDFTKGGDMFRRALDCREKPLGKDHESTKLRAENLALFLGVKVGSKDRTQQLVLSYPRILNDYERDHGWYEANIDYDPHEIVKAIEQLLSTE